MASSNDSKINEALLKRVMDFAETYSPKLLVANPNREFERPFDTTVVPPKPVRHLDVNLFRSPTASPALRTRLIRGIMQVSVFAPLNEGPVKVGDLSQALLDWFDPHLPWLVNDDVVVRIDPGKPPYAASPLQDVPWYYVPVVINWFSQLNR